MKMTNLKVIYIVSNGKEIVINNHSLIIPKYAEQVVLKDLDEKYIYRVSDVIYKIEESTIEVKLMQYPED
jgi:hypothetical protein